MGTSHRPAAGSLDVRLARAGEVAGFGGKFVGADKCLGADDHAANIEGLAARSGVLYFGFREPAKDETAYIATVRADALFGDGSPSLEVYRYHVGGGRGIRDLLAVPDGIPMLLGPDDDENNNKPGAVSSRVAIWDGSGPQNEVIRLKPLAELDIKNVKSHRCDKDEKDGDVKPEAMVLVQNDPGFYRLLVLSDGMCDGGPMSFKILK